VADTTHLVADRKQREAKGLGTRHNFQKHLPSDLLPPARSHLLKCPQPPKIAPSTGGQAFNKHSTHEHMGHFHIQIVTSFMTYFLRT
jgi:hypothetical protein